MLNLIFIIWYILILMFIVMLGIGVTRKSDKVIYISVGIYLVWIILSVILYKLLS